MRAYLLRIPRLLFNVSGPEKKNIFKLPQQQFIKHSDINKLSLLISSAESCGVLAAIFKVLLLFFRRTSTCSPTSM